MENFDVKCFKNCFEIRFSSIREIADNETMYYKVVAPFTDVYKVNYNNEFVLYNNNGDVVTKEVLNKNEVYYLVLKAVVNETIIFDVEAVNNKKVLPFESNFKYKESDFNVNDNNDFDPLKPATLNYFKRENGTYINANHPETLHHEHLNKALIRDKIKGNVFFTFEHNNLIANNIYYGYMVKNINKHNVYITVKNLGYHDFGLGSWLGQNEWIQFYNTDFKFDTSNFNEAEMKTFNDNYSFSKEYKPELNQPITFCLPPNEEMFVLGGTTDLSYNNYNVFNTANRLVEKTCSNAAVYFDVVGGEVEGSFYAYDNNKPLNKNEVLGYIIGEYYHPLSGGAHAEDFGIQYAGSEVCDGVVENEVFWEFNDKTESQLLPVTYKTKVSLDAKETGEPFSLIPNIEEVTHNRTDWATHINPHSVTEAVATDMTTYKTVHNGKEVVIDPYHYDGRGGFPNIGNWMIDYQERYTFVNKGDKDRDITINFDDTGSCAILIRDQDGNVVDSFFTLSRINDDILEYKINVKAHSVYQFTFEYNLLANSYGHIKHSIKLS